MEMTNRWYLCSKLQVPEVTCRVVYSGLNVCKEKALVCISVLIPVDLWCTIGFVQTYITKFWRCGQRTYRYVSETEQFACSARKLAESGGSAHYSSKVRHMFSGKLAMYKCIFSISKVGVYILLKLTLGEVLCMIQKSFSLAVSPVVRYQKIYKGFVCIVVELTADKQHIYGENFQSNVQLHGHFILGCPYLIFVQLERTGQCMVPAMQGLAYLCSL